MQPFSELLPAQQMLATLPNVGFTQLPGNMALPVPASAGSMVHMPVTSSMFFAPMAPGGVSPGLSTPSFFGAGPPLNFPAARPEQSHTAAGVASTHPGGSDATAVRMPGSSAGNGSARPTTAVLSLNSNKRERGSMEDALDAANGTEMRKSQCVERSGSVLSIPGGPAVRPSPPPKSGVPGIMAPGPDPADTLNSALPSELSTEYMWPVLPYFEALEHLLKDPAAQPLTFHRRVTRPLTHFIAAVVHAVGLKDTSRLGVGLLFLRAIIRDDIYGRLAVYDTMQGLAERADWTGFVQCVCEYMESAGFDISKLFASHS